MIKDKLLLSNILIRDYNTRKEIITKKLLILLEEIFAVINIKLHNKLMELGCNSLKAIELEWKIFKTLGVEVPIEQLFTYITVEELIENVMNAENMTVNSITTYKSIEPIEEKEYYESSSAQKRMYALNQFNNSETNYNMPSFKIIEGKLDVERFKLAFKELVKRHDILRTSFELIDEEVVQQVHKDINCGVPYYEMEEEKVNDKVKNFIRPFDLSKAPLIRAELIKLSEDEHLLLFDMHHIISDGISMGILWNELSRLYKGEELPELRIQYKDFSAWQNEQFKSEKMKKQEEYWLEVFKEEIPVLNMPTDYTRPILRNFEGDNINFRIEKESYEKLKNLMLETNSTMYMVLLAAYNILLSKYSGQEDIVVGSPIAGRRHEDLDNMIGMFVNTLAMRNYPKGDKTFREFLIEIRENALKGYENQDYQFEELVEKLNIRRDMSRNPLFDVMFVLQNIDRREIDIKDLNLKRYGVDNKASKFDMTLYGAEREGEINLGIEYATKLFKKETIERMVGHFLKIVNEIVNNYDIRLSDIDMVTEKEKNQILYEFNDTKADYPKDKTIHQLFEEQVEKTPDNIAVVFEDKSLTYRELNEKSNQLARLLRNKGVKADSIVGIMVERSIEMIVGIMGILKAGGAYLPIDSEYPRDRINYMLEDSGAEVLLTQSWLIDNVDFMEDAILIDNNSLYSGERSNLERISNSDSLAYVIYTSGSTGKPKGVLIMNKGLVNYIAWANKTYVKGDNIDFALYSSLSFDLTITSIFTPLVSGNKILIYITKDNEAVIRKVFNDKSAQLVKLTPAHLEIIKDIDNSNSSITKLIIGGEELKTYLANRIYQSFNGNIEIYNEYGPTETVVGCTVCKYSIDSYNDNTISIGKPADNANIYILNQNNNIAPIGVTGELCIGGDGLARGYLNRPELTAEKFVENPFIPGERMYKTGDLARWLPDGNIEFIGRVDHQVKIRGFRVELGEIESKLLENKYIKEAVVLAKEEISGNKYLCGYIVAEKEMTVVELKKDLSDELPEYMIPSYFIQLKELPLTSNGKIDRKVLLQIEDTINTGTIFEEPTNPIEEKLLEIWKEVLGMDRISINDNFFDIGGHSLKAIVLISKINKVLNVEVKLPDIFKYSTIKGLAEEIEIAEEIVYKSIESIEEKEYYESSSAQKRMFALNQFSNSETNYNMPDFRIIEGKFDVERFELAFKELVKRHDILRTSFELIDEEVVQRVDKDIDFEVPYYEMEEEKADNKIKDFVKPFDLGKAPLIRVELIRLSEDKHLLLSDMHHIISDGISMVILWSELSKLYKGENLEELRVQYKDFSAWQNKQLKSETMKKQEEYWLEVFKEEIPVLNMPTDYTRPILRNFEGDNINFRIEKESYEKLKNLMLETNSTMYMVLLAAYNILLSKYSGQEDIVVGSPIAGRRHEDLDNMIGMFVNTLAMRNYPKGDKTFREFLIEIRENALKGYENQDYQFEELVEKLNIRRDMSRNPLFDVMFVLQNIDRREIDIKDLNLKRYGVDNKASKFDMTLYGAEREGEINLGIEYATKLFKKETIERMVGHFLKIVNEIVNNYDIRLSDIDMVTEKEKNQILYEFNDTKADYPKDKTIHQLFEEQVEKTPDNIAVVFEDKSLTYRELNEKSNQLARLLRNKGVKADSIVGIMVERSIEMIVGIMGILKAGGAYLPIDSEYPRDRIKYMLEDSGAEVLLTQSWLIDNVDFMEDAILIDNNSLYSGERSNLERISNSDSLAYVIYTSGSTGKPKGVLIEHYSLINRINWMQKKYPIGEEDIILQKTPFTFDVSIWEIFWWSIIGAKVYMLEKEGEKSPELILKTIQENKISIIHFVPSMFSAFLEYMKYNRQYQLNGLRQVFTSGEELTKYQVKEFYRLTCNEYNISLSNLYGPTEATVDVSYFDCDDITGLKNIPIGKPIDNIDLYIVDKNLKIQPIGVAGELCISGDGLARGYLNREELTAEKFVDNPFIPGERIYKTGDLARWLSDGNIEFIGRVDHQVKIRGFRVELGEIESKLLSNPYIKEAVVLAKEEISGNKYLCGYIVAEKEMTVVELKKHLSDELPEYMIPSYFIQLEKLPLTSNGKIDRKVLLQIEDIINTGTIFEEPTNPIEEKLLEIWKEVLGMDRISINDNFFDIGGHSLKAIVLISKINKVLNVEVKLPDIFKYSTIKGLAEEIEIAEEIVYKSIESIEEKEYYESSSAQKRMFALNQFSNSETNYNMPDFRIIEGKFDVERFELAFKELVKRHDILRTSFELIDEEVVQRVDKDIDFEVPYYEMEEEKADNKIKDFVKPFDLGKAPLIRVELIRLSEDKHLLLFDMHHIISDGISMGILWNELSRLYKGEELPELRIQYKDFSAWQNEQFKSEKMKKQEEYWLEVFKEEIPVLNMPTDYTRPILRNFEGDNINFRIEKESYEKLKNLMLETNSTMYMVLLAAYNILLSKYSGQEDIVVGSPIAGRRHEDLDNMIGMFVNTLAMRNYPKGDKTFREFLIEIRENALKGYENQDYQFEELVEKLNIRRDMSRNPLFDVMFVLQNIDRREIDIKDLNLKRYGVDNKASKFDMTLYGAEREGEINLGIEYATKLFKKETIERMVGHFLKIVNEIVNNYDIRLSDIDMVTEKEKNQILYEFNDTKADYPKDKTIHQLFEEQVEKTPDNIAVVFEDKSLTYRELNEKSNQLARLLRNKGVKADSIVGIMVERSIEMIVGIMGILKAGGAYLPIDPEYPKDRINYMLEDSSAEVLITQKELLERVNFKGKTLNVEDEKNYENDVNDLMCINESKDLAYIIYTSGTTGKPKGTMINHKNVVRLMFNDKMKFDFNEKDVWTMFHSYCFDFSVWEMYGALLYGGKLVLISRDKVINTAEYLDILKKEKVTILNQIPTLFYNLMNEELKCINKELNLRYVIFGGDVLKVEVMKLWMKKYPKTKLINMYGITEITVHATFKEIKETDVITKINNIGKPIPTLTAYIIDKNLKIQPIGVAGELCISGDGLARGYLNREELTAEKFVENPFIQGERMYKTGDLARWLPDGNIEFIGRIDHQVKIRGFRVELGEIESKLLNNPYIKEAVVLAKEEISGNKYLCGYIVAEKEMTVLELKKYLSDELPEYMVPSYFIQLEKLPLTSNGKIDRKALLQIEDTINTGTIFEEPTNPIEEKLLEIWKEVLGMDRISINDNFFDIGGHSLKAIVLISKINKVLNVEVKLPDIFKYSTIKGLAEEIEIAEEIVYKSIESIEEKEYYESSSAQKRMFALNQFSNSETNYNMPDFRIIEGKFDVERFELAFKELVKRHDILRTSFELIDEEVVQRVDKDIDFEVPYYEMEEEKADNKIKDFVKPFDLGKAPLIRVELIRLSEDKHLLLSDMHHIISDGISMVILWSELSKLYKGENLEELRVQYKDFSAWQNKQLKSETMKKQEEYWLEVFKEEIPVLNMPTDYTRPILRNFEGDNINFRIEKESYEKLKNLMLETNSTMYMVLLAAYNILLSKYSGQEDIVVGSPIAGRRHEDLDNMIGMFVNTLAMRNYPKGDKTFREFLIEIRENALKGYENQDYQFEELVEKLNIRRDMSRNPLFDVMFVLQNIDRREIDIKDLNLKRYGVDNKASKFDMTLYGAEREGEINLGIEYATKLFKKETIERMVGHFLKIVNEIVNNYDIRLSDIDMVTEKEKNQILYEFNDTKADYPKDKTIHQLFEEQVEKTPDNIAVVFEDKSLTYRELNEKSNQLARLLRNKGVKADSIVGIMVERSIEMIVGIMGILKAGGAYLPIDPEYPKDRINYMLEDSSAEVLITQKELLERVNFKGKTLNVEDEKNYENDVNDLMCINESKDLAYIIYTSGTTGKPKGTMINHKNVVRLMFNDKMKFDFNEKDVWTMFHSYCFDFSVWEMYGALLYGGKLVLISRDKVINTAEYLDILKKEKVTILNQIPTLFYNLMNEELKCINKELNLRYVIFGGDVLKVEVMKLWMKKYPKTKLINMYGITEITVHATFKEIKETDVITKINNIGKPIPTLTAYIIDKNLKIQPIGVAGELCISGDGLARGYLNREELTAEKFVENPFIQGERMYKTGDLARWLPDGNIEFIGRIDHQVKIRGFRVELGEIESKLLNNPYIKEAVVLAKEEISGNKYLCGYIVAEKEMTVLELKKYLSDELPEYMVPSYFIQLEKLPLTSNGKIDRKALLQMEDTINTGTIFEEPTNPIEEKLLEIWKEVLGMDRISINDNFFDIGGHSLKAIVLISKINKVLNVEVKLPDIFKYSTIKGLAEEIEIAEEIVYKSIESIEEKEYYESSSAQKRMFALNQFSNSETNYNMPDFRIIEGKFDVERFELAFKELVKRHDILRTSFELIDEEVVQRVDKDIDFEVPYYEMEEEKADNKIKDFVKPFDLGKAPLIRVELIRLSEDKHLLLSDMHHIISDGISMVILWSELSKLYKGENLEELRVQYKDFSAWQNKQLKSETMKKQEEYWLEVFKEEIPVLNMPTDYTRPILRNFEGDNINFRIEKESYEKLKNLMLETNSTMYMVLLAAYNILLSKYSGQEDIVVGSPIAGRRHEDLDNMIGMFVNTLAMRNYPKGDKTFREFLIEIRENALKGYENQDYQFEELVEKLNIRRDMSRNPLFDVMFVLQNIDRREIDIKDLNLKRYGVDNKASKFDMTLYGAEREGEINLGIEYATKLFKKETIERMVGHFLKIVNEIVNNYDIRLSDIDMVTEKEKNQILYEFNDTKADYPKDKTIHQLFEEQVEKTPDNIAVVFEDKSLTYRELNEKSNQLARLLRNKGVKADSIVGIMVERSIEMIVGIMGILKAGGAYLPIDPEYPKDRINYMLEDSSAEVLITQKELLERVNFKGKTLNVEDEKNYENDVNDLMCINESKDLAYIIYTSGTTGKPKGTMINHKNVVRLMFNDKMKFDFNEKDVWTMFHSYCFDFSVWEMYGALLYGGKLVLISRDKVINTAEYLDILKKEKVTILNQIPTLFYNLMNEELKCINKELNLRYVIFGGDVLKVEVMKLWMKKYPKTKLINMYGITEITVHATFKEIKETDVITKINNIGKPIPTLTAYIIDKNLKIQPIGVAGELCISGDGLARGYLNREELTAEKFVENPFIQGERMYKTGDLARWLPDGNIEFIGRIDHQVKIRGFRVELGEIESKLLNNPYIKEAVVLAKEEISGNKYLCGYIVAEKEMTVLELKKYLSDELPEYMVPSYFIQLEKLPLTSNGKIDRKALLQMEDTINTGTIFEEPTNPIEEKLLEIWKEVLGMDRISINDNFFDIGGHSLKAIVLISKINKVLNVEVKLPDIFKYSTIKGLAEEIEIAEEIVYKSIESIEEKEYYESSSAQKRMFALNQFSNSETNYNMPDFRIIEGKFDVERFELAFKELVKRHDILRTSFELIDEEVVQRVDKDIDFEVPYYEMEEEKADNKIKDFVKPFDLGKAPLIRVELIRLSEDKHLLLSDMHHIISDGISMVILWSELSKLYKGENLEELRVQYKDFSAWQNKQLKSETMKKQEEYWLEVFKEEIPVLNMPTDYTRPILRNFEGDNINFRIEKESYEKLKNLMLETNSTMYMVLLAAYNILLSKYSGQEDIVVGSPIAGRRHEDLDNMIGMFVNTLAMRNYPKGDKTFREFLIEIRENALKGYENQDYQFEELVEKLNIRRDMSRNPLFDVMFVLQNIDRREIDIKDLNLKRYGVDNKASKFDMTLYGAEREGEINLGIEYATKLFKKETIERMVGHFLKIVNEIVNNYDIRLSDIDMVTEKEKNQILYEFNDTKADYPKDKTIHQLFEEQVEKTPDNIAVVFEDKSLTYRELNEKSNQLARLLRNKGVKADSIVGIMVERSIEMIVGIMGILKAGGAYLPIDSEYPRDRINYMLEDSGAEVLLTQSWLIDNVDFMEDAILIDNNSLYSGERSNLERISNSDSLAYVIYTSGSTGKPKGVLIMNKGLVNYIAWANKTYVKGDNIDFALYSSLSFDLTITSIFTPLVSGNKILIYITKDNEAVIRKVFNDKSAQLVKLTPAHLEIIKDIDNSNSSITKLIIGGEELKTYLANRIYQSFNGNIEIYNEYGPTETVVGCTVCKYSIDSYNDNTISIGKPADNANIYILNQNNNIAPIGVTGELCIGGDGLARGYLNRPELTAEKFVENPFIPGERMYKTGDLARWLPDGNIEFIGRVDHQVKIRGFRVELGEIESKLLENKYIKEAVVLAKEEISGNKYLCGYIVAEKEMTVVELKKDLSDELPEYMIPSYFIQLKELPLTSNGKINRKALFQIEDTINTGTIFEEPTNPIEEKLLEIWKEVLGIDRISINDNFFNIGGHSLKAIVLISKIKLHLSMEISLSEVFKFPTIKEIANRYANLVNKEMPLYDNRVVLLRAESNSNKNIFLIHDGSGEVGGYVGLANKLDVDFNIYGVQVGNLCKYSPENIKIEELAYNYIKQIQLVQKKGPYFIGGWSIGGTIAFEIVKQLEEMDENVQLLLLIDAYVPNLLTPAENNFTAATERYNIKTLFMNEALNMKVSNIQDINKIWKTAIEFLEFYSLECLDINSRIDSNMLAIVPDYGKNTIESLIYYINTIRTLSRARNLYIPSQKIRTNTYFFKPKDEKYSTSEKWNEHTEQSMTVIEIPGNHFSALKSPHIFTIADEIKKVLDTHSISK